MSKSERIDSHGIISIGKDNVLTGNLSTIDNGKRQLSYSQLIEKTKYYRPSFKELSKQWKAPRIKKVALPDLTIYPKEWTYLVSNEKHPHTITPEEFRKRELKDGDKIYFERGQIYNWLEYDIIVDNITVGSFGSGVDPIFYGSTSFTAATWTSETGGYYSTPLATAPLWVTKNGECARQGESAWIATTADATSTTVTADLDAYNAVESLVGVKFRHKEYNFRLSYEKTATNYNTSTNVLTVGSANIEGGQSGLPIKLYGQKQFATLEGDWWYDDANDKLWIKTVATPAGTDIRVITELYAFKFNGSSNSTVQNIDFTQYFETAINAPDAPTLTISNVDIHDNRSNGLMLYGNNTTFTLDNFSITRCGLNAIHLGAVSSGDITEGTITEIGMQDNIGWPFDTYWIKTGGTAICCFWDSGETVTQPTDVDVTNVVMSDLGYIGVLWIGDNHSCTECVAHDFCLNWNDGAGFYSIHRNTLGTSTKNITYTRCHSYNGYGSIEGITGSAISFRHASGLYVDNGCELITINECVFYNNNDYGILANWDTQKTTITNCILFGNVNSQITYKEDTDALDSPVFPNNDGNILTGNLVVASDLSYCVEAISRNGNANYNPFSDSGDSDNNTYVRPYGTAINASRISNTGTQTPYTIATWRTHISDDAASTERYESTYLYKNPLKTRAEEVRIATNETGSPISVNASGYHSVTGAALGSSESIPAWGALVYLVDTWPTPDYLYDTFTAADGTNIAGRSPAVGPIPAIATGVHTITSNEMVSNATGGVVTWAIGQSNIDFTVRTRSSNISSGGIGTYFRRVDDNNRFVISFTTSTITLFEFNASGSATNTWSAVGTFVNNAIYFISVRANGTSVKIWVNGQLYIDITTSYTTAGQVGFLGQQVRATEYILAESI